MFIEKTTHLEKSSVHKFSTSNLATEISAVLFLICVTLSPYSVSVFMSKWRKYLEMSLIGEYLNSVKSEKQKFNFGCQAACDTKEVRYWYNKSTSLFLNWNTMLSYITMNITINNTIITNKIMSLCLIIQQSCWGVYWFHSVRLSVRPSVCPTCRVRSVTSTVLDGFFPY